MTHYRLSFHGALFEPQVNALCAHIAAVLERPDCASLTVLFAASDGDAESGFALYDFIRALPLPVHMHALGPVGSVGLAAFLAGQKRSCAARSRFTLQVLDRRLEGRHTLDDLAVELTRLEGDIQHAQEICRRHTRVPQPTLETLRHPAALPAVFSAEEAKEYGIVEDVVELNPDGAAQPDTATWAVSW